MTEGTKMKRSGSFKSLLHSKDQSKSPTKSPKKEGKNSEEQSLKKSKSSTSLSSLFSRPRSSKGTKTEEVRQSEDKENEAPSGLTTVDQPPPIWAQFATTARLDLPDTIKVPLNDCGNAEETLSKSAPGAKSPSKSHRTQNYKSRGLSGSNDFKSEPELEHLAPNLSSKISPETLSGLRRSGRNKGESATSMEGPIVHSNQSLTDQKCANVEKNNKSNLSKRGSRVLEVAAHFNQKAQDTTKDVAERPASSHLEPAAVEIAFEALLDARNVPMATRDKMRSLDTNIKADFVKQNKVGAGISPSVEGRVAHSFCPDPVKNLEADGGVFEHVDVQQRKETPKKSRPRSLTFTFSKSDQSPSKRQRSESHKRTRSGDVTPCASPRPASPAVNGHGTSLFNRADKFSLPEQVLGYLRKVRQPQSVEVGKIQKLRQLLRNETVGWVDTFIAQGGMTEIVELLYRTIAVEWREEHEDILLHENLLCLKALSTTSSAMQQMSKIQNTLFPTVLRMLFDEERKGPSEYNTRTIIINLLHSYLVNSKSGSVASRTKTLLSYICDQSPAEKAQAPAFITSIYHPRPYKTWHKELHNLTKEVFWIFLHHHNIIPYPPPTLDPSASYQDRHFPKDHPPVAAAPYIGGVEWDATAYITAHLDLLNGFVASLPTRTERNQLRREMKDSGFEKLMGASLRTCKEKFYGSVHEALSVWIGAAREDGWDDRDVRQGPPREEQIKSPTKKGKKKDQAPQLAMPKLNLGSDGAGMGGGDGVGDWL